MGLFRQTILNALFNIDEFEMFFFSNDRKQRFYTYLFCSLHKIQNQHLNANLKPLLF